MAISITEDVQQVVSSWQAVAINAINNGDMTTLAACIAIYSNDITAAEASLTDAATKIAALPQASPTS